MAHHETTLQMSGYVTNLVYNKCSPQNYKRGAVWVGGSKVGWVGIVQNTPPPLINEAWQCQPSIVVLRRGTASDSAAGAL